MKKNQYEMFCHLIYAENLSYEELLEKENQIIPDINQVLLELEASYINFEQLGDSLNVQCVLTSNELEQLKSMANDIASIASENIEGRIVLIDAMLDQILCFFIVNGKCQAGELNLPSPRLGIAKRPPRLQYDHESLN